jgi:hypothetical protein
MFNSIINFCKKDEEFVLNMSQVAIPTTVVGVMGVALGQSKLVITCTMCGVFAVGLGCYIHSRLAR